jgi:GNAT superfamily N-acetyltransferase
MSPTTIRPAAARDAAAIAELVTDLGYPTSAADMSERLAVITRDADYATFVAESVGRVIGVAGVRLGPLYERSGLCGQVMVIAVRVEVQGKGVGRALLTAVEGWARQAGAVEMVVRSGDHREDAHRFYERQGYRNTGRRFIKFVAPAALTDS